MDKLFTSHYLVKHRINRLIQIDMRASVLGILAVYLGLDQRILVSQTLSWLLIVLTVITFAVVFCSDQRDKTEPLMRAVPMSNSGIAVVRGVITAVALNLVILLAFAVVVLIMRLIPGREFGIWRYPIATSMMGEAKVLPLYQVLLKYWLIYNLWVLVIGGAVYCMSTLAKNPLVIGLIPLMAAFAGPLHLLALLPAGLQQLAPSFYLSFSAVVSNTDVFGSITFTRSVLILAVWGALLWFIGSVIRRYQRI